ncbi:hypothetical protein EV560_101383 [Bosea sp. BK604]|nr:hypothetical protein EV560_101383 [Bosea sp. BK604]
MKRVRELMISGSSVVDIRQVQVTKDPGQGSTVTIKDFGDR